MASLSNTKIKDTYESLVKFSDNGNITVGAKQLTDGFGNNSPFFVSTTQIGIGVTPTIGFDLHVNSNSKIGGNLVVGGNLTVNGTLTYLNVEDLATEDPLIKLARNNDGNSLDIGYFGQYVESAVTKYKGLYNDADDNKFKLFIGTSDEPTTVVNTGGTGYAVGTLVANLEGNVTGTVSSLSNHDTNDLVEGSVNLYYTNARADARVNLQTGANLDLSSKDTDDLSEGSTNLYFTTTRARASFTQGTGVTITDGEIAIGQDVGTTSNVTFNNIAGEKLSLGTTNTGQLITLSGTGTTTNGERGMRIISTSNVGFSEIQLKSNDEEFRIGVGGTGVGTTYRDKFYIYSSTAGIAVITVDESQNTVFSGDITIGTNDFIAGTATIGTVTGNLTGNVTGNINGNAYLNTTAYQGGEGTELDNSAFNVDGIGTNFRWIESNSGSTGSTWKKIADIVITDTITPNGVQLEAKIYQPNTNSGVTAGLHTIYYSVAFRGRIDDSETHNDAIVYGKDANLLRVYKTADYTFELQARSNDDNRDLVVECNITSKKGGKVTPTTTYVDGTITGGTAYTATANNSNKTKFAGDVEFEGAVFDDAEVEDLRVNEFLFLGAQASTTYGPYLVHTDLGSGTGYGAKLVVRSDFQVWGVTGNAGEQHQGLYVAGGVAKLYDLNGVVLETVLGGVDITGTLEVSGTITGDVTGDITGNVTGNITGNLTGDVTGDVTGDLTGSVTGAASLNVLKAGDTMTGNLILNDNVEFVLGSGTDFKAYHNETNTLFRINTGDLIFNSFVDDGDIKFQLDNGADPSSLTEYMRLDGGLVSTVFSKPTIYTNNTKANFGSSSLLSIDCDGTNGQILQNTGDLYITNSANDKSIIFQSDDGIGGVTEYFKIDGNINRNVITVTTQIGDNTPLIFGSGSGRPSIKYDSTASQLFISGSTNLLSAVNFAGLISSTYSGTSAHVLQNATSNGTVLQLNCTADSSSLYLQGDHIYASGTLVIGNASNGANLYRATQHTFQEGTVTFDDDVYLNYNQNIYFNRNGTSDDYSNIIGATNYPTGGYNNADQNFWIKAQSKGGFHIVLNSDGTNTSAENAFDDFVIFQGEHDGTPRFRVSNVGSGYFSNKLGVGTASTSAYSTLEVGKPLGTTTELTLSGIYSGGNNGPILNFRSGHPSNNVVWNMAHIQVTDDGNYNGRMNFMVTQSGGNTGSSPVVRATLKATGNFGVGTQAPYERLVSDQAVAALGATQTNASQGHATIIDVDGTNSRLMGVDWGAEYKPFQIQGKTIDLMVGTGSTASALTIANDKNATFAGTVRIDGSNLGIGGVADNPTSGSVGTKIDLKGGQDSIIILRGSTASTEYGLYAYNGDFMITRTNQTSWWQNPDFKLNSGNAAISGSLTVNGNNVVGFSGTWNGANMPGSRFGGYSSNGGEVVFQSDNPSSGRMSILVDGQYYAGENGGFYSLSSGNNYNNGKGFYADSSGVLQFNSSAKYTGKVQSYQAQSSGAGDHTFFEMLYAGGWSQNVNGLAAINVTDGGGTIVKFGGTYNGSQGVFVVTNLYSGGYGATGDMLRVSPSGISAASGTELYGTMQVGTVQSTNRLTIGGRYSNGGGKLTFRSGHPSNSVVWNTAEILATDDGNYNGRIEFRTGITGPTNEDTDTKMVLKATGRLGIGTVGPSELFHLSGGNARFEVDSDSNLFIKNAGTNAVQIVAGASEELYVGPNDSYKIRFLVNGNVAMDNGGKFGIGTSNPNCGTSGYSSNTAFLHVYNDTNNTKPTIHVSCHDYDEASLILSENSSGGARWGTRIYYEGLGNNFFNIETSDSGTVTHRLTIDRYGKFGYLTVDPKQTFDVRGLALFNGTTSTNNNQIYDGYVDSASAYLHSPAFTIRQDSSKTGSIDEAPVALCIHNQYGADNTMSRLVFASKETQSSGNTVTIAGIMARKTAGVSGSWASGELSLFTKSGVGFNEGMIMDSGGRSTFYYTSKHTKGIRLNRAGTASTGISWYSDTYYNWQNYMASAGAGNCGPNANLTAPSGLSSVTSWALRSRMEGVGTYGWIWETGGSGGGGATASAKMELGATNGTLRVTGDLVAYASDKRLKTNVKNISNPIEKIKQINGVEYDWVDDIKEKYDFHPNNMHEVGVLAQEIEKVLPEAVLTAPMNAPYKEKTGEDHNFLTVKYERIVPLLIESIKELTAKVEKLENKCNCK